MNDENETPEVEAEGAEAVEEAPAEPEAPEEAPEPVRKRGRGAVPEEEREPTPKWGYNKQTGEGVLFSNFMTGDRLPDGFVDSPAECDVNPYERT